MDLNGHSANKKGITNAHTIMHSRYPFRSVICKIQIIIDNFSRQGIFPKIFFPVSTNCAILGYEMNDMQNRILCVKCSANGELSPKRKARLTV